MTVAFTTEPLQRRDELVEQFRSLDLQLVETDDQLDSIRARECPPPAGGRAQGAVEPRASRRRVADVEVLHARGEASDDEVAEARLALRELEQLIEELTHRKAVLRQATRAVRAELKKLRSEHRDAFIAEAEEASEKAHALLETVRVAHTDAYAAWVKARAAWGPLVADLDGDLGHAPLCPLTAPSLVEWHRQCTPPELADARPPSRVTWAPGTVLTYAHDSGQTQAVEVGGAFHRAIEAQPGWRLVDSRPGIPSEPRRRGIPMVRQGWGDEPEAA